MTKLSCFLVDRADIPGPSFFKRWELGNHDTFDIWPFQRNVPAVCGQDLEWMAGKLTFPEIAGQLTQIGVERYHADYSRREITYYFPDGDSVVIATPHLSHETAAQFSASVVADAVRQSQRNEHSYADFIQKTMSAGCVGYFVQITGRQVIYFGRSGESHVERFPPERSTM